MTDDEIKRALLDAKEKASFAPYSVADHVLVLREAGEGDL